jgi:LPXTG-motif cell wall-anchored protein
MGDSLQNYTENHGRSDGSAASIRKHGALIALLICAVLIVTGGLAVRSANAATSSTSAFTCAPGYVYSQQSNGSIKQYAAGTTPEVSFVSGSSIRGSDVNGLGIGKDGATAFAYSRSGGTTDNSSLDTLYKYSGSSSNWTATNSSNNPPTTNGQVAGAVDLSNGNFVFGAYATSNNRIVFKMFEYIVSSQTYVNLGYFNASSYGDTTASNGDIAFDAAGNLYVVRSVQGGDTTLFTISAAELLTAQQATSTSHVISPQSQITGNIGVANPVNGIAFDTDGTIYLGTGTRLYHYKASSWEPIGSNNGLVSEQLGSSTDLASCNSPSTVTVRKNIPNGRAASSDQFSLTLSQDSQIATVATSGSASGIQSAQIGPIPAMSNQTYSFGESMASGSGTPLSGYDASWQCINTNDGSTVSQGSGSSGTVLIPQTTGKGAAVTCTITNVPKSNGSISWSKVDSADSSKVLGGSVWELTGPTAGNSSVRTVEDCVAAAAANCTGLDKDPAAGKFLVNGLVWGNYTLKEKSAPSGYELSDQVYPVAVNKATTISVGPISNKAIPQASVIISKTILSTAGNQSPGVGWAMSASLSTRSPLGTAVQGTLTKNTNASGTVDSAWPITFTDASQSAAVTVAETQQQGYEFSSGSCVVTTTSNVSTTIPLAGTSGDVAGITPGSTVRCNLINKQVAGTASWSKTADDGHSLKGSVWTLTYPDGSTKDITGDDQGHFSVANLPWGAFKLVEKEAPAGYQVDSTEHAFTIDATHLSVTVADSQSGSVVNNKQNVPDLPMTGGASTDLFMISGAVVLILAAALGSWHIVSTRKRMRESSELKQ